MTQFETMSPDYFESNEAAIRTAVHLLRVNAKRRKRFQLATVYEKRSGELLVEVFATSFGPVVVYAAVAAVACLTDAVINIIRLMTVLRKTFRLFDRPRC